MNLRQFYGMCLAGLVFASAPGVAQDDLQHVINGITEAGTPADVGTAIENDGYWSVGAGGGLVNFIAANSENPDGLTFGIFDAYDMTKRVTVYDADYPFNACTPASPCKTLINILQDGSVKLGSQLRGGFVDTGVDFAGNLFGLFITQGGETWYSIKSLNSDQSDHLKAVPGNGSTIDIDGAGLTAEGVFLDNEHILGWEDNTDNAVDYSDLVLIVESLFADNTPRAALGDFVWDDLNGDGIQGDNEPGVAKVMVQLLDCSGNILATDTTGADGSYFFGNLLPGGYQVKFFAPSGYGFTEDGANGSTKANDSDAETVVGNMGTTTCIDLVAGETNRDVDAGLLQTASLGNYVWEDLNYNGLQDDGEPGVPNVTVKLNADCNADGTGGTSVSSTTTNSSGLYLFDDLEPGNYCVEFVLPNGYDAFTKQNQPNDDTIDSDADTKTGRTVSTTLDPGENDLDWDAGVIKPASLGDFVWNDLDRDGIQDDNEPGIKDVLVELLDCDGNPVSDIYGNLVGAVKADDNGSYEFVDLRPGKYTVKFTADDKYAFTTANVGESNEDPADDSDALVIMQGSDTIMGTTACVTLQSGENNPDVDAGLYEIAESKLGDFVWDDLNADGTQDPNEPGILGIKVELYSCVDNAPTGNAIQSTTTDVSGIYSFVGLTEGSYAVKFDLAGYLVSPQDAAGNDEKDSDVDAETGLTACVDLGTKDEDLTLDAGVYRPASLGDFVWIDVNSNGIQDADESGVAGVTVELFDCSGKPVVDINGVPVAAVTTVADGAYSFGNLIPGGYTVKFTAPDRYEFTTSNAGGSTEANDSDAEVIMNNMGTTGCVTLVSGENNPDVDAGLLLLAECDIFVNATCSIVQQPVSDFVCKDAKPIDTLQMIWTGEDDVTVVAHYGTVSKPVLKTIEDVDNDELVSISGFAGSTNDVEWEVFDKDGNLIGISRFHLSCSDSEMNGPEDCGLPAGDGKDNGDSLLNEWLLEGMAGANGNAFQCTPPVPGPGAESCTFTTPAGPHCEGKVLSMSLRYTGGDCTFSNTQDDKAKCLLDGSAGEPVRIVVSDGGSKIFMDEDGIEIGDVVEATAANAGENEFRSNTVIDIYSETGNLVQSFEMHTSCSKPLNLGDQFGAVEVVRLNTTEGGDASLGAEVVFDYQIVNNSVERFIDEASDSFGLLGSLTLDANGGSASFSRTRFVLPGGSNVFTNTLAVTGELEFSDLTCEAQDSVPVMREEPPAPQLACDEIKPITQLSMVWNGDSGVDVLTEGGQFFGNVQNGNLITFDVTDLGNDVELTLSGAVIGMSAFHVSCSDDSMDGPEDCTVPQGNNKGDESDLINDWGLEGMIGETGSFICGQDTTGEVLLAMSLGTGGGDSIVLLESWVDGNKLKMEMENLSDSDLFIESVDFVWPEPEQYVLKKIKFNGDFVKDIEKTVYGTEGSIMLPENKAFEDDPNKRKIKKGEKRKLEIEFDADIEKAGLTPGDFGMVVAFDDGTMIEL